MLMKKIDLFDFCYFQSRSSTLQGQRQSSAAELWECVHCSSLHLSVVIISDYVFPFGMRVLRKNHQPTLLPGISRAITDSSGNSEKRSLTSTCLVEYGWSLHKCFLSRQLSRYTYVHTYVHLLQAAASWGYWLYEYLYVGKATSTNFCFCVLPRFCFNTSVELFRIFPLLSGLS